jgi:hypothetical protein
MTLLPDRSPRTERALRYAQRWAGNAALVLGGIGIGIYAPGLDQDDIWLLLAGMTVLIAFSNARFGRHRDD